MSTGTAAPCRPRKERSAENKCWCAVNGSRSDDDDNDDGLESGEWTTDR